MSAKYAIEHIAGEFLKEGRTAEQQDLVKEMKNAVVHGNNRMKMFLAAVCEEAYTNQLKPVNAIALGVMYGLVLGVLAEQDRTKIKVVQ